MNSFYLLPASILYWGVLSLRNLFYKLKIFKTYNLPCKIISIGNISTGGTGKTPTVIYLAGLLKNLEMNVSIISRGYKRETKGFVIVSEGNGPICTLYECGDEPYMMSKKLKNIPIVVDENRYRGCKYLVKKFNPDVIIMDDGFQHISLQRNIDIVLIDGSTNFNNYKLLPNGILREPWNGLKRADAIFITKKKPESLLKRKLDSLSIPIFQTKIIPLVSNIQKKTINNSIIKEKVYLFSGIGNPNFFSNTVKHLGYKICGIKKFPDHYSYTNSDIIKIEKKAKDLNAKYLITTEKDWFKLETLTLTISIIIIEIKLSVTNENKLLELLELKN